MYSECKEMMDMHLLKAKLRVHKSMEEINTTAICIENIWRIKLLIIKRNNENEGKFYKLFN